MDLQHHFEAELCDLRNDSIAVWGSPLLFFLSCELLTDTPRQEKKKDKIKKINCSILEMLRVYLNKNLLKLGHAKLEVFRNAPPTRRLGKDIIKKKTKTMQRKKVFDWP